jgi:hypothetical protein
MPIDLPHIRPISTSKDFSLAELQQATENASYAMACMYRTTNETHYHNAKSTEYDANESQSYAGELKCQVESKSQVPTLVPAFCSR